MTTGEKLLELSTLESGTALQHFLSIRETGTSTTGEHLFEISELESGTAEQHLFSVQTVQEGISGGGWSGAGVLEQDKKKVFDVIEDDAEFLVMVQIFVKCL